MLLKELCVRAGEFLDRFHDDREPVVRGWLAREAKL
jgi:hypothetical protein